MEKMIATSSKQKKILEIAKKKGYITWADLDRVYTTRTSAVQTLKYFVRNGILKSTGSGIFKYLIKE